MSVSACVVSHSDLGGIIERADPVHKILLVIGLQEELPHPSIDDLQMRTARKLYYNMNIRIQSSHTLSKDNLP